MNQADTTLASVSPTHSRLIPYMIIGLMMVCVAAVFVRLGQQLAPTWDNQYLLAVSVCIALESAFIHSQHATRRPSFPMPWLAYRTTEWVIIVVALKFVIQSLHGTHPIWQGLAQWFPEFLGSAFDEELLAVILMAVVSWGITAQLSSSPADVAYDAPASA